VSRLRVDLKGWWRGSLPSTNDWTWVALHRFRQTSLRQTCL